MNQQLRNKKHNPHLVLAARDVNVISLKTIFDNLRNYLLGAVVIKGAIALLKTGDPVDLIIGMIVTTTAGSLMVANIFQTYLITYLYRWQEQEQKILDIPEEKRFDYKMLTAFSALVIGTSIIYVLYRTLPF